MGIDHIPEPLRSEVLAAQEVRQDVVLGYWDELLRSEPERLQARKELVAAAIHVPVLPVCGEQLSSDERDYVRRLVPSVQLEEWRRSSSTTCDSGGWTWLSRSQECPERWRVLLMTGCSASRTSRDI